MRGTTGQALLGFCVIAFSQGVLGSGSFSLPLEKKVVSGAKLPSTHRRPAAVVASTPEIDDQGFWFANFTVGAKNDLVILIDTGSSDLLFNPGVYAPSSSSVNLHKTFSISFATTNPDGSGTETLSGPEYKDIVTLDGSTLTVKSQTLGSATSPASPPSFPHDGLMGFAGTDESSLSAANWFNNLCTQGTLTTCRFGLAFETDNTGVQYFGEVATDRFTGSLSVASIQDEWQLSGDIALNGKVLIKDANIITDSGTTIIFGPLDQVTTLFKAAGITAVTVPGTGGNPTTINGYYPCASPPTIGFGFPSTSQAAAAAKSKTSPVSRASTIFNILASELAETSTASGTCTSVIHGTDAFDEYWLVGQAFFQGRYIDHNVASGTMGFANLKN